MKGYCNTCSNAQRTCLPPNVVLICNAVGMGVVYPTYEFLSYVGCEMYSYDKKGLTDLERSFYKK